MKSLNKIYIISVLLFMVKLTNNAAVDIFKSKIKSESDVVGLYAVKDDVEILTIHNFKEKVYGSERAWFVEFYNAWCGYCQRFAPSWKEFATDVKKWKDLVSVAAIDCSNDENNPLCREFEIMGYPSLRYFHENYVEGPKNYGRVVKPETSALDHRNQLMNVIAMEQSEGRGKIFPVLTPYTDSNLDNIFNNLPTETKFAFLIVQNADSHNAQQVALDLHKIKDINIRPAFKNLSSTFETYNLPTVIAFDRNKNQNILKVTVESRSIEDAIVDYLKSNNIMIVDKDEKPADNANENNEINMDHEQKLLKDKIKKMGDVVFQMDLETALRFSLKREIARTKEITGEKLEALKKYLNVLVKYFPFGKYGKLFLLDLKYFIESSGSTVSGLDISKRVKVAEKEENQVFSSQPEWLACKGSDATLRGYPCGLWKLFHYLTVNHADHNADNKNANPLEVLEAMHGYIKNFFGCSDCSMHFQEMAEKREMKKVDSLDKSVMWLWQAHNEVNNRLSGDATEDPEFPKVQFPIKDRCNTCHLDDDSWDTAEVLKYLKHIYSNINVRYIGSDTRILHLGLEGSSDTSGSTSGFKTIDTNLFLGLLVFVFSSLYF